MCTRRFDDDLLTWVKNDCGRCSCSESAQDHNWQYNPPEDNYVCRGCGATR